MYKRPGAVVSSERTRESTRLVPRHRVSGLSQAGTKNRSEEGARAVGTERAKAWGGVRERGHWVPTQGHVNRRPALRLQRSWQASLCLSFPF